MNMNTLSRGRTIKYIDHWKGACKLIHTNPSIAMYIKNHIIATLLELNNKQPFQGNEQCIANQWYKELNEDKKILPNIKKPSSDEYEKFVKERMSIVDNKERSGCDIIEIANECREVCFYIELLEKFDMLDEEMKEMKEKQFYYAQKAVDMFKLFRDAKQAQLNVHNSDCNNKAEDMNHQNYNVKKKEIRLKFGGKKNAEEKDVDVGQRTYKVMNTLSNQNLKQFTFPNVRLDILTPIKIRSIDYYKVVDNIKKVNNESLRSVKKGRLKEALNFVQDSLEYLKYIDNP